MKNKLNSMSLAALSAVLLFNLSLVASAQTLINGANQTGTLLANTTNSYSFTANAGDTINLRMGTTNFDGVIDLFGPNGVLLKASGATGTDDFIQNYAATNSGTFTVLISAYSAATTGTYVLHLAQTPESFIVPSGDEGGPMTNGGNYAGTITLGDLDMWTFTANAGDTINLRMGTMGFDGVIDLFGPNGALLKASGATGTDDFIQNYTATNSGTFTVLISAYSAATTGTYVLHLAQFPEPFIVPSGEQGGSMTGSASYAGTITLGDQDIWAFTACTGDSINLELKTTNFDGNLDLYGSNGTLLKTAASGTDAVLDYTATNCGTFTVLVSSYSSGGTGTYVLTDNGLADTLRVCHPVISGASLTVNGVGGSSGATFILYSTTNVATPFGLWTPVLTNQFDQFGVFGYTNIYIPAQRQQFFRFLVP